MNFEFLVTYSSGREDTIRVRLPLEDEYTASEIADDAYEKASIIAEQRARPDETVVEVISI